MILSLSNLLHLVWPSLGPSTLLQMALFHSFHGWAIYSAEYSHQIIFIHSWVNEHLDCFRVLAIANSVAVNIGVYVSFCWVFIFSRYMFRSGIAGSYGSSIFSFLRIPILFSIVATSIYIPVNTVEVFPFSSLSHRDRVLLISLWF